MKAAIVLKHKFVEYIPNELQEGIIYVSIPFGTAAHKCCCGCGSEVVTPITPTDWELIFNGETISLHPSIGNWSLACRSHYWIRRNRVKWAPQWTREEINAGRAYDATAKKRYFDGTKTPTRGVPPVEPEEPQNEKPKGSIWQMLARWWF